MRRSYRSDRYLGILDKVRDRLPRAAITTDIIVGFPGETEEDFLATMDVVRQARFASAFTFQYSQRPGTPAASMPQQVEPDVVQERYTRLVELVNEIAWEENRALEGEPVEVLIAGGEGRKDERTMRASGRARDNRLVHIATEGLDPITEGDLVTAVVTYAAPHHLVADEVIDVYRREGSPGMWPGVPLGMPGIGAPAT
jgi:tRNA-2-methylthio-N6-dimethylallyladenosine synthase